jgi:hypothetical protein
MSLVIGHDLAVPGQHEDGHLRVAVLPLRGDVRGDHAVAADLGPRPVPVIDQLRHRRVAPVVVVVPGAGQRPGLAVNGEGGLDGTLGDRRQPGEQVRLVVSEQDVPGLRPPGGHLPGQDDVCGHRVDIHVNAVAVQVPDEGVRAHPHVGAVRGEREVVLRVQGTLHVRSVRPVQRDGDHGAGPLLDAAAAPGCPWP